MSRHGLNPRPSGRGARQSALPATDDADGDARKSLSARSSRSCVGSYLPAETIEIMECDHLKFLCNLTHRV